MKCRFCGGQTIKRLTRYYDVDMCYCVVIVKNVPGHECKQCGEMTYSEDVMRKVDQIVISALTAGSPEIVTVEYETEKDSTP